MCLGIPGQVIQRLDGYKGASSLWSTCPARLARSTSGCSSSDQQDLAPGDWVLIHMGFAIERTDAAGAKQALQGTRIMGRPRDDPT